MTAPLVEIRNVSRRFASRRSLFGAARMQQAVNDVSFDLPHGQVLGVVGESGCGKSTLARLALRLIEPSAGSIRFDGADLLRLPPRELRRVRRRMQMVRSEEHTSELQSLMRISYAVFCLKKKKT